jgi:hypothetical protein
MKLYDARVFGESPDLGLLLRQRVLQSSVVQAIAVEDKAVRECHSSPKQ